MLTIAATASQSAVRSRNPEYSSQNTAKPGSAWQRPMNPAKNCASETDNNRRISDSSTKIGAKCVPKKLSPPKIGGVGRRGSASDSSAASRPESQKNAPLM